MVAGWGLSQETPKEQSPDNLKILRVKIFKKSDCRATPEIETNKQFICAGVPGKQFQATCLVNTSC